MEQKIITLSRRLPDAERLAWADKLLANMKGRRPKNRPEVYAEQARYIHENPTEKFTMETPVASFTTPSSNTAVANPAFDDDRTLAVLSRIHI
mgnify:CR=1 FL=1